MSLHIQTSESACGTIKQASTRAHMCQSVCAACLKRIWKPTCEGVWCLLWECVWYWEVGGCESCQADGGAPCVTSCHTGLLVDTTSVNISVCGEKVMGREVLPKVQLKSAVALPRHTLLAAVWIQRTLLTYSVLLTVLLWCLLPQSSPESSSAGPRHQTSTLYVFYIHI